jgi:DNA polymerase I-like protein with 3'-5' exonuclease and polymerase domains
VYIAMVYSTGDFFRPKHGKLQDYLMGLITADAETYYDSDYTLSKMTTEEYINDPRFQMLMWGMRLPDGTYVTEDTAHLDAKGIRDMLHDYRIHENHLLCQNTMFDGAILNWRYGVRPTGYFDTMLMARLTLRHMIGSVSLKSIANALGIGEKGTEVVNALGKRREDFSDGEWRDYREYCTMDVALTYNAFTIMLAQIPKREFKVMNSSLRWYIEPLLELDTVNIGNTVYAEKAGMEQTLKAAGLDMKTLSSQPQFQKWLESMNVAVPMKPSPTNPAKQIPALAKSDKAFQTLCEHNNPVIATACKARLQAKSRIKETRLERLHGIGERNNHKLPVPLQCYSAHTLRYTGGEKINLQNLPVELREGIMAPEGHKIISADQGQIEARINAVLSGQDDLIEGFRNDEDVYSEMATGIYGVPVSAETEPNKRKVGKAIVLGAGYGMGGERCYDFLTGQWRITDVSREFAQMCINTYRTRMWNIVANWKTVDALLLVIAHGGEVEYGPVIFRQYEVELPSGCKLRYPDMTHDGENYKYRRYNNTSRKFEWVKIYGAMMVENLCQALARELLTDQMCILEKKWPTVHNIHDELWFVVPDKEVDLACGTMQKIMTIPPAWMPELPLKVEPSSAVRASDLK